MTHPRRLWLVLLPLLAGCGGLPKNVVVLMPDEAGEVGQVIVRNAVGEARLGQALAAIDLANGARPGEVFIAKQEDINESFAAVAVARPRKPVAFMLYFRSEATQITPESWPTLQAAITEAKAAPNVDVSVIGHTDAAGTEGYNVALSLRRAEAVKKVMIEGGVPASVIEIAYHGASNPLVPTPPAVHEPRNRRVEITVR